ncbi:hypothetical protein Tco_0009629 [Tanacetum coccineum]
MISPAFVEAHYEVLESLLREQKRQKRNEDLRTKLEYFSEEYDEEKEMKPRPIRNMETTPFLRTRSSRARRQRERIVDFEDVPNWDGDMIERTYEGGRPSILGTNNDRSQ